MTPIRVLVADNHVFAVPGLCAVIAEAEGMQVVGQTLAIGEVVALAKSTQPDVIVLDIAWPVDKMAGIKIMPDIRLECPNTQIVAISVYPDLLKLASEIGAYPLEKGFSIESLLDAIRWAAQNKAVPATVTIPGKETLDALTSRECQVLRLVVQGLTDRQISGSLRLAEGTVKKHISNILGKLHVNSRTEAAVRAIQDKICD